MALPAKKKWPSRVHALISGESFLREDALRLWYPPGGHSLTEGAYWSPITLKDPGCALRLVCASASSSVSVFIDI